MLIYECIKCGQFTARYHLNLNTDAPTNIPCSHCESAAILNITETRRCYDVPINRPRYIPPRKRGL